MSENKSVLNKVGEKIKVESISKEFLLNFFDLTESSTDKQIEEVLGDDHLFDKGEVYSLIGGLISKQPNGEEGALLNIGYSNLFYTSSCVVDVGWDGSSWDVNAWHRRGGYWLSDGRVFSPATSA